MSHHGVQADVRGTLQADGMAIYWRGRRDRVSPGVHLASTGVVKSSGACRGGSFPRKSSCKLIVANDDNYALAA